MSKNRTIFQASLSNFNSVDLWSFHLKVSADIAAPFIEKDRRILLKVGDLAAFACALMPDGKGDYFISINKERRNKLGLKLGDTVTSIIEKDESKYGMPIPEVMEILLAQDEEANKCFHMLTPGKQRSLLHIIGKPKTEVTRLRKAIVITEYLKTNKGKLDFTELQIAFKEYK